MNESEYEKLLASLPPVGRVILAEAAKGPVTAPGLHGPTGRTNGMTPELRKLMKLGLLRDIGVDATATKPGMKPVLYERVPMAQVEAAQAEYAKRVERGGRKKRRRAPVAERLAALPKREKGRASYAINARRNVNMLTGHLAAINREMVFWDEATHADLVAFVGDLELLTDTVADLCDSLHERFDDDAMRTKIAKLREVNGRTEHEIRAANGLAAKLERQRRATG